MTKNKGGSKHFLIFCLAVISIFTLILTTSKNISNDLVLGLDLQGGFEILYEVSPLDEGKELPSMDVVSNSVRKRVDVLGVSEPQIIIEGNNQIRVQLAGVSDQSQARRLISSTANLTFRDINDELLADATIIEDGGATLSYNENGQPVVALSIKDKAKFKAITTDLSGRTGDNKNIVTWLDFEEGDSYKDEAKKIENGEEPKYISIAGVSEPIDGDATISGNFTEEEARELANLISSGSLPVKMTEISSNVVSAEFGIAAFDKTIMAGVVGILLVIAFMIIVYKLPGLLASIMLAFYVFAVFFVYSSIGAVFTLTGIAALVLGVGMTVDANIITFERIKEELYLGRSLKVACANGQKQSFSTIFDAQFTTLLAALIMYIFGNGAVKGFATMLMITVVCTLVLNVVVSRFLLNQVVNTGWLDNKKTWFGVKAKNIPHIEDNQEPFYTGPIKKYNYIKGGKKLGLISSLIVLVAVGLMIFNNATGKGPMNLGIDFSSGTKITVTSNTPINVDDVKTEFVGLGYDKAEYQLSGDSQVNVTIKDSLQQDKILEIKDIFLKKYGVEPNDNVVTPIVGQDLVRSAFQLSIYAWIAMLIYITLRFKWDYAVSCIVALLHDVAMVLAFFIIFRIEVNIELISVILAIIGYSINNSIVVFDRIRELLGETKVVNLTFKEYATIVNQAVDNTILRSVFSSITTILPVIALLMLGSSAIFIFNIAMFVGLIAGTLSSIYVSPYVWYLIRSKHKVKAKKVKERKEELDEYTIKGINS